MLNYILVDDDTKTLKSVKKQLDSIKNVYGLQHLESFESSKKAYEDHAKHDFDLLIVDFEMPVYNGIELAQRIAKNKNVIFLTSTINNEKDIINSVNIVGYLSKPFDLNEFKNIFKNKLVNVRKQNLTNGNIILNVGKTRTISFHSNTIYYISTARNINGYQPKKNHINFYDKDCEVIHKDVRLTITELEKKLASKGFLKIDQSTLINKKHLKERDHINLELYDCKETFMLAETQKNNFFKRLKEIFN